MAIQGTQAAMRIEQLVTNAPAFCAKPEDRFKVWPTNRDRPAFHDVMGSTPPVNHDRLKHRGERMVEAHRFFSEQAREWLTAGGADQFEARASAIDATVRDLLQMVVIDLGADENAQEIFETLNARGAQLTAADLIKNFVFQRLLEASTDVEDAYQRHWKNFETAFWETEVSVGRVRAHRSSIFLNHWLVARTGDDVVAREVFSRFKAFADFDAGLPMATVLEQIHRASEVYRDFLISSEVKTGAIDRLALFAYRTGVLESEVIKPLILHLLDPEQQEVPETQFTKALDVVESWMVRRMLVRATAKAYNKLVSDMIRLARNSNRADVGDVIESFLKNQKGDSQYWPDDNEVRNTLKELPVYRRLSRGRLRMVLEAIEDHRRGWKDGRAALGGERVARGAYAIEHIMPRKWDTHWERPDNAAGEAERDRLIHTLGNLTLLMGPLNSKVSNGPWAGPTGKQAALKEHCVLFLNRPLAESISVAWTHDAIRVRTEEMIQGILEIWPVPAGHRSDDSNKGTRVHRKLDLTDLLNAGVLTPGMTLYPGRRKYEGRTATLLADGQIDVDGKTYPWPSPAAAAFTATSTNGWWFFRVDRTAGRSLRDVLREYVSTLTVDVDDDSEDEANPDETD
jgi:hypothetical protein